MKVRKRAICLQSSFQTGKKKKKITSQKCMRLNLLNMQLNKLNHATKTVKKFSNRFASTKVFEKTIFILKRLKINFLQTVEVFLT